MGRLLKDQSARIKKRTLELIPRGLRTPGGGGFVLLDEQGEEGDDGEAEGGVRRRGGRGDKYKREVEREVERIKVKVRLSYDSGTSVFWCPGVGDSALNVTVGFQGD